MVLKALMVARRLGWLIDWPHLGSWARITLPQPKVASPRTLWPGPAPATDNTPSDENLTAKIVHKSFPNMNFVLGDESHSIQLAMKSVLCSDEEVLTVRHLK